MSHDLPSRRLAAACLCGLLAGAVLPTAVAGAFAEFGAADRGSFSSLAKALRRPLRVVKLDLRRSGLTHLPAEIGELTNLKELYLSENELTGLPDEIRRLGRLEELGLSRNRLRELPPVVLELATLEELYLDENALSRLPAGIGRLTRLRVLEAGSNQITAAPRELGRLVNLERLWLTRNRIGELPAALGELTALEGLFVSYNQLTEVPARIGRLERLEELYLNDNRISRVDAAIGELSSLRVLDLSDNELSELPPEVGRLAGLERLFLGGNRLTTVPPELARLSSLQGLSLNGNRIAALPPELAHLMRLPVDPGMFPLGFAPEEGPGPNRSFYRRGAPLFEPPPDAGAPPPDVESLTRRAERALAALEDRQPGAFPFTAPPDLGELAEVGRELERHLEGHAGDVDSAILLARVRLAETVHTPIVMQPGQPAPQEPGPSPLEAAHGALDRALAVAPENPELHHWKARLHGLQLPVLRGGTLQFSPRDLQQAIAYARKALSLAPGNLEYRAVLALFLVQSDRRQEALELMRQLPGEPHRITVLLEDLERLPLPDEAVPATEATAAIVQMGAASGQLGDYPQLRVVGFYVPRTATELEAFFAERIEGFALFRQPGEPLEEGAGASFFLQLLTQRQGRLAPASSPEEIDESAPSGLILMLTEFRPNSPEVRAALEARGVPSEFPDAFCLLLVTNQRATPKAR